MNLFEAENTIKNFSDEQLGQEMLSPTGFVPQYMIMSELNRRKTMRQEAGAKPAPNTSIADEMKQGILAMAQQGPQPRPQGPGVREYQDGGLTDPRMGTYTAFTHPRYPHDYRRAALEARNRVMRGEAPPLDQLDPALDYVQPSQPEFDTRDSLSGLADAYTQAYEDRFMPGGLGSPADRPSDATGLPRPDVERGQADTLRDVPLKDSRPPDWQVGTGAFRDHDAPVFEGSPGSLDTARYHPFNRPRSPSVPSQVSDESSTNQAPVGMMEMFGFENEDIRTPGINDDAYVYSPEDAPEFGSGVGRAADAAGDFLSSVWEANPITPTWNFLFGGDEEDQTDPVTGTPTDPGYVPPQEGDGSIDTGTSRSEGKTKNTHHSPEATPSGSTVGVAGQVHDLDEFAYMQRIADAIGFEPGKDGYGEIDEQVDAMREELEDSYSNDKWMALANLGATMAASDSPHFAQAFGEGANAGIAALRDAKKQQNRQKMQFLGIDLELADAREAARRGDMDTAASLYSAALSKIQGDQQLALKRAALAQKGSGDSMARLEFYYDTLEDQLTSVDKNLSGDVSAGIPRAEGEARSEWLQERDRILRRMDNVREELYENSSVGGVARQKSARELIAEEKAGRAP